MSDSPKVYKLGTVVGWSLIALVVTLISGYVFIALFGNTVLAWLKSLPIGYMFSLAVSLGVVKLATELDNWKVTFRPFKIWRS